jgi:regulator of protease activity HflC (stomatin/prohibitin superfamily)
MVKVSLRTLAMEVPPQDVITRDNVSVKVSAVVFFRVLDPRNAVVQVQDFLFATSQIAQTTLRSVLGASTAPSTPSAIWRGRSPIPRT